jgi:hypothetical protein
MFGFFMFGLPVFWFLIASPGGGAAHTFHRDLVFSCAHLTFTALSVYPRMGHL